MTLLVALAAYRLWRLAAKDTITQPLRDRIPIDSWVHTLIDCPWCLGTWLAFGVSWAAGLGWVEALAAATIAGAVATAIGKVEGD